MSIRIYIERDDGTWFGIPAKVWSRFPADDVQFPEFASSRRRVIEAHLKTENRIPVAMKLAFGTYLAFDASGSFKNGLVMSATVLRSAGRTKARELEATVVDIGEIRRANAVQKRERWQPSGKDIDAICADIWPKGFVQKAP